MLAFLALTLFLTPQQPVRLFTGDGVEAPEQPSGRSSAGYGQTPRFEPESVSAAVRRITTPIGNLAAVRGQEENYVVGIGLVTGLSGTGDSANSVRDIIQNLLFTFNINVNPQDLTPNNVALVRVEAVMPPGIKPGRRVDVRVSAIGDADSLLGGTLALTELTDITGNVVYVTAAGPVLTGGFSASGEGASTQQNIVTVGVLPLGGKVEREVPANIVSEHNFIYLDAQAAHGSFGNIVKITDAVNRLYPGMAAATPDGRSVRVRVPTDLPEQSHVAYLDSILSLEIEPRNFPRVVVNERSGVIVMGEGVRLRPGVVAQGSLTITIAETPEVSQPGPFSDGVTTEVPRTELDVQEENNGLFYIPGAVTLQEVVEVLNVLGATPRETISILEAMSQAGLLLARIERV